MRHSQGTYNSTGQGGEVLLTPPLPHAVNVSCIPGASTRSFRALVSQLLQFTGIGVLMTLAYLALYAALQGTLSSQEANAVAWVATAVADTSANRRLTFGVSGRRGAARAQAESLLVFATGALITSGSLLALDALVASPSEVLQVAGLVGANAVAGVLRFTLLRCWVFAPWRLRRRIPTVHAPSSRLLQVS